MLSLMSAPDAMRVRRLLRESGYTEEAVTERLKFVDPTASSLGSTAQELELTREPSPLNFLLRWFWMGKPQERSAVEPWIPGWFCALAVDCGLFSQDGLTLIPQVMLLPVEGVYIASDHKTASSPDLVLWPNPTSRVLSHFTVRKPVAATLDVGTGNGIQALAAAGHSQSLVATDLNPRAIEFARFNARLNGVENLECRVGDGFHPVAGQSFDLIVSNPPFYITPSNDYVFCDNPMELDALCRLFAREAAAHLNEGGYFQMLCEWAQVRGQPWQHRIGEWFETTGCNVMVFAGGVADPAEYAQKRIHKSASATVNDELYQGYMRYYHEKGVEAIHNGLVAMRRRSGDNWIEMRDVPQVPSEPFGESVLDAFAACDFLRSHSSDDQMLTLQPVLSPHARLEQVLEPGPGRWQSCSLNLRLIKGLPAFVALQPMVADFLAKCDGTRTLAELVRDLAAKANAPAHQVQKECLGIVRRMMEQGFLQSQAPQVGGIHLIQETLDSV